MEVPWLPAARHHPFARTPHRAAATSLTRGTNIIRTVSKITISTIPTIRTWHLHLMRPMVLVLLASIPFDRERRRLMEDPSIMTRFRIVRRLSTVMGITVLSTITGIKIPTRRRIIKCMGIATNTRLMIMGRYMKTRMGHL